MEDHNDGGTADNAQDPIKQLKGEFGRKTDKMATQLEQMAASQAQLLEQLARLTQPAQSAKPAPKQEEQDLSALMYSNPAEYARVIREQAKAEIRSEIGEANQRQASVNAVVQEIASEYPELANPQDPLTKKAQQLLAGMPDHERATSAAMKLAVKQAAEELEVKPRSKRPVNEDFGGSGSNPYGAPRERGGRRSDKLAPEVEAWAQALELDIENPEVKQRLIARQQRDWSAPKEPLTTRKKGRR